MIDWYNYIIVGAAVIVISGCIFLYKKYFKGSGGKFSSGSTLAMFSRDLTQEAKNKTLDPVIGREDEIEEVIQILARRNKNNPVLVGKAGVGKTAIVEGLARAIIALDVPKQLENKRVLSLDLSGILAGTKYRGEFEQRLKSIADEIIVSNREIILFIDEIHTLAQAGDAEGAIEASDILKPALARGELQVVGATTLEEYKEFITPDPTLARRLETVMVEEPNHDETLKILQGIRSKYENYHKVKISNEALEIAITESDKKMPNRSFPDKAIDLIDEASAKVSLKNNKNGEDTPAVEKKDVLEVLEERIESIDAGL